MLKKLIFLFCLMFINNYVGAVTRKAQASLQATKTLVDQIIAEVIETGNLMPLITFFQYPSDITEPFLTKIAQASDEIIRRFLDLQIFNNKGIDLDAFKVDGPIEFFSKQLQQLPSPLNEIFFDKYNHYLRQPNILPLILIQKVIEGNDLNQLLISSITNETLRKVITCSIVRALALLIAKYKDSSILTNFPGDVSTLASSLSSRNMNELALVLDINLEDENSVEVKERIKNYFADCQLIDPVEFDSFVNVIKSAPINELLKNGKISPKFFSTILDSHYIDKSVDDVGIMLSLLILTYLNNGDDTGLESTLESLQLKEYDFNISNILNILPDKEVTPLQAIILYPGDINRKKELIKLFISVGADINATDSNGLTPLQAASDNQELINFLMSLGAKR